MGEDSDDLIVRSVISAYKRPPGLPLGTMQTISVSGKKHLLLISGMDPDLHFDQILASIAPLSDFTVHIRRMQNRTFSFSALVLALALPLIVWLSHTISAALMRLEKESQKVRQFDFSESEPFDSHIKEIHANIQAFVLMKTTIRQRTEALVATQQKLEKLVESGIALTAENDMDKLLETIFNSARVLSQARGGILYLRDEKDHLHFEIMQTASRETFRADTLEQGEAIASISLFEPQTRTENHGSMESHAVLTGKTVVTLREDAGTSFEQPAVCRLENIKTRDCNAFLTVPLKPRQGEAIGVLQLYGNGDAAPGRNNVFEGENVGFVEALAAQAAVTLHNKKLLDEQRTLFNALIQLIAGAIAAI